MKEQLLHLYRQLQQSFVQVVQSFPQDDLAGPFLISPTEKYKAQHLPLLVVGQETKGWSHHVDHMEKQMVTYEQYNVGSEAGTNAFWNIIRKIEDILGNEPCSCAWTNISRFDLYGGKPHGKFQKAISPLDTLVAEEIKILKPQVCFFFTGPDNDKRLSSVFPDLDFVQPPSWPLNQLCLLKHPALPPYTFRSYHPKSLRLRKLEGEFMSTVRSFMKGIGTVH